VWGRRRSLRTSLHTRGSRKASKAKARHIPQVCNVPPCPCQKAVRAPNRTNVLTNRSAAGKKKKHCVNTWQMQITPTSHTAQRPRPSDCSTHPHPNVRSARSHRSVEAWRTASQKTAEAPSAARAVTFSRMPPVSHRQHVCLSTHRSYMRIVVHGVLYARAVTGHRNWKKRQRS
jgi:hypothetical protein